MKTSSTLWAWRFDTSLAQVDWFWAMGCSKMTLSPQFLGLSLKAFLASMAVLVPS